MKATEIYWVAGQKVSFIKIEPGCSTFKVEVPAGVAGPPPHIHHDGDEYFHVLEGAVEVYLEGAWHSLWAGQSAMARSGMVHTFRNPTDSKVELLVMFRPGGLEHFFRDIGVNGSLSNAAQLSLSEYNLGKIVALAETYGMTIQSPELDLVHS